MTKTKKKQKDARQRAVVFIPAFVKSWRKSKKMTQETLAAAAGMSTGNLSNIETGIQGYTQENIEAFAKALGCHPADLIAGDPGHADSILAIWARATPDQRRQILRVVAAVVDEAETASTAKIAKKV